MSLVLTRIDNRLIHGQVLEAWVPHIGADCIVVANDEVARVSFQKTLMAAAVPKGIKVLIDSVENVARAFHSHALDASKVLLLFASSGDAVKAHRCGVDFKELNLGNMHGGEGKVRYSCTIALDPADVLNFQQLEADGVRIVCQCVPPDRERSWKHLLHSVEG
ncbi:PTS fructose transporter subunit IIB [Desulfuromonas versatilis]|uniref:PTS fructose transporter subunit IIB n=1 Tax=Desulfuromonas versatilis TaxID=2802975 RepID=A0ABM8HU83_9BACT|nr:PTS sugar transporter subunit IIB [Desulfuromonas versatilis]BCR05482.1 PTS fructose transporter subunit IIB [Desulfuromonas versatilis]